MRIVCLSAEAADICARLGAWDDVIAVSAFASQSGLEARPVIGGFSSVDADRVARLRPDLVITFSDVQADIAARLIRAGCTVLATNQRTLGEIGDAIRLIGGAIGRAAAAETLSAEFQRDLDALETDAEPQPRVYFEEWPDPPISAIGWVGEIIERCGGTDLFAARRGPASLSRRVEFAEVIAAAPDMIIASWCGKTVDLASIRQRPGFSALNAIQTGELHTIDSDLLLQPGPRVLEGARQLSALFDRWRKRHWATLAS